MNQSQVSQTSGAQAVSANISQSRTPNNHTWGFHLISECANRPFRSPNAAAKISAAFARASVTVR
jgi:hypothetical protein